MKGFVKILETVIACVILLTSLAFFFTIGYKPDYWTENLIQQRSMDLLVTAENEIGSTIKLFHSDPNKVSQLNINIRNNLPSNVEYNLIVEGVPKPKISVACISCSDAIENMLAGNQGEKLMYKGRQIIISVDSASVSDDLMRYDVILYSNVADFSADPKVIEYLSKGKNVMLLGDITGDDMSDKDTRDKIEDVFSAYYKGTETSTEQARFHNAESNYNSFMIDSYVKSAFTEKPDPADPLKTLKGRCNSPVFGFNGGLSVNPVGISENSTLITNDGKFSRMTISERYGGMGLWLAMPSNIDDECSKKISQASVMWLSSQGFYMKDANFIAASPPEGVSLQSVSYPIMFTNGNIENAEFANIRLVIWRVFF